LGKLLEGLQKVVWASNLFSWAHCQVGEFSGRPDPLVGDGCEPGRWGPRGTHVSQAPERCVGVATLKGHDKVIELLTRQMACTSVQNKRINQLSSRPVCSLCQTKRSSDDL
jgi:hypothetical protein